VDNTIGVLIAIASSCLGGSAAAVTRYLASNADPIVGVSASSWYYLQHSCCA
jgi:hypothetical protein